MERFKKEAGPQEVPGEHGLRNPQESKEQYWPSISAEENRFIEDSGGEYQGFVERVDGKREFEDVLVSRCAYYDSRRRAVVEAFVTTEAVNDEGTNELEGPSAIKGYMTMVANQARSGETLDKPLIVALYPEDFSDRKRTMRDVRLIAHEAQRYVILNAPQLTAAEVETRLKAFLVEKGWDGEQG